MIIFRNGRYDGEKALRIYSTVDKAKENCELVGRISIDQWRFDNNQWKTHIADNRQFLIVESELDA
jgi:hypothetical protein